MGRNISFAPGEFYHLYNRGTEKRNIFSSKNDYERFLTLLYLSNGDRPVHLQLQGRTLKEVAETGSVRGKLLVEVCAYVLMPNHFHLLVREKEDGGISLFMQKLLTGYTMYFNKRHNRTGALFQGKFKATHADTDRYLTYLFAYIHLNPVKLIEPKWKENGITNRLRAEKYIGTYPYSSFPEYLGAERPEHVLIDTSVLPTYADSSKKFKNMVTEWLAYKAE